jgi:hypothetical protein
MRPLYCAIVLFLVGFADHATGKPLSGDIEGAAAFICLALDWVGRQRGSR